MGTLIILKYVLCQYTKCGNRCLTQIGKSDSDSIDAISDLGMRVLQPRLLTAFWGAYPDAERALRAWFHEAKSAAWRNPAEIKAQYRNASILKAGRVVFNISGNKYRLVVAIDFRAQIAVVRWVGTHADYDRIDVETV